MNYTARFRCQYPQKSTLGLLCIASADQPVNLEAVWLSAMILAPCRFLREADQVGAGDMVMVADFAAAHAAEKALGVVRVDFADRQAVGFLMVDPVQLIPGV